MPVHKGKSGARSRSKSGGLFGGIANALEDTGHRIGKEASRIATSAVRDVTGFPTAIAPVGETFYNDFRHGPWSKEAGDSRKKLADLETAMAKSFGSTVRHPVRSYQQDAFGTLLAGLGTAGAIGGVSSRLAAAGRAGSLKAALRKPVYTRTLHDGTKVDANPNPIARAAGAVTRAPLKKSKRYQNKTTAKTEFYQDLTKRRIEAGRAAPGAQTRETTKNPLAYPMDVMRASMYMRPRTAVQNALQSSVMLLTQQGLPNTLRSHRTLKGLDASHPEIARDIRASAGDSAARSYSTGGTTSGKLGDVTNKLAKLANWPEKKLRPLSMMYELYRRGYDTPEKMEALFANPESPSLARVVQGANDEVGDFGRLGPKERMFMKSQIPIFYPMFKALTRYGIQFPTHHSVQAGLIAAAGAHGKQVQEKALGPVPWWASYLIPKGDGKGNLVETLNPTNVYNFQPAMDIATQLALTTRKDGAYPGVNFLAEAGPALGLIYNLATGKDLSTGYPLRGMDKDVPGWERNQIIATLKELFNITPAANVQSVASGTQTRSYEPGSLAERIGLQVLGPALVPRTVKKDELNKQAKKQQSYGRPHPRHSRANVGF